MRVAGRAVRLPFVIVPCLAAACFLALPLAAHADDGLSIIAGNPAPGIFDTLELVADGAGFYRREHLIVTKAYASGPAAAAQLVAGGKADVASMSVEPLLIGSEKGLHLQVFLARQARYSIVLAVLASSPIRTLADFKGALIGEPTAGSSVEPATTSMLAGAGLRPSDFSYVPVGSGPAALSAVLSGRVAGIAISYLEIVNDTVAGHVAFRTFRNPVLKDIANVGYAATPATIRSKAGVLQRFSRAIVEASLVVRTNPAAAARFELEGSGRPVTADALAATTRVLTALKDDFPAADPANPRIGLVAPRSMELLAGTLAAYGFMNGPVRGADVATGRFIGFANDFDRGAVERGALGMH
jgi:NitT/TauT family transport system substrate-binding protein